MSRPRKRVLIAVGGAIGLVVLLALAAPLLLDVNRHKPRLEAAATDALGMDVRLVGRLGVGFFPGYRVTADDVRILDAQGVVVASAKRASFRIALLPLLRKQVRLRRIELTQPRLSALRDSAGALNVEGLKKAAARIRDLDGASLSLSDGTLLYVDGRSRERLEATGLDLNVSRIRLAGGRGPQPLQRLTIKAVLACRELRTKDLTLSALKATLDGKGGVFELAPVTMRIFGGLGAGSLRVDASGPVPLCQLRLSLPRFRIEEFLATLSPQRAVEGAMDFSASLSMQGTTMSQLVQTAGGVVSLRGRDLTLVGNDLDRELARFASSQSFNLVDVGAVFLAGPLGLAVTKGYNFASLFKGPGGTSRIRVVVSDWKIERGIAQAKDVALATSGNRIALQGGLDLVNGRFADMTVAVVDAHGCARVRQAIRGPFGKPEVEKPRVLTSLAGPVLKLYRQTRGLFPAAPCDVFYSGTVAPPR